MSNYLLEIGVEELPYKFIPSAINQLKQSFENLFNSNSVNYSDVNVYATPRRLAVIVKDLDLTQKESEKSVKGPIQNIAYNPDGTLSNAGLGFAKKNNVEEKDLFVQEGYLYAKIKTVSKSVEDLLKESIPQIIFKMQGSHFMRWSDHEEKFSRPIRWLVSLLDEKEIKITILDVTSSKISRGHRFSENKEIEINKPDEYIEKLKTGNVFVDQNERKNLIVKLIKENADKVGAYANYDDDLLEEVTYICEYPVAVICDFSEEYLKIPQEVAVTVMEVHQRYFALYKDGKLINKFITVTNYVGDNFENIKAGNLRVIKARLDDAVFFFKEDTKKPLESYLEKLKGITFQKNMGSMFDKTQRIIKISEYIKEKLGFQNDNIRRTAELCKADLATNLVFEFTELQGFIGADYARVSGENNSVAEGIKEHYFPLNADSELALGIEGQIVGIADKIDTICAVFASGKNPTGSSDPLGVRRAVLGIIKTVLEKNLKINLSELIKYTIEQLPVKVDCFDKVEEFFIQRLFIYLSDRYDKNILEACANNKPLDNLSLYIEKINVVSRITDKQFLESANRVSKILKERVNPNVDTSLFTYKEEEELYNAIKGIDDKQPYLCIVNDLIDINKYIENFFEKVLVMDKDEKIKQNRMALLENLKLKYEILADFSKI